MHELSLCQAIAENVDRRAGGRRVRRVEVRIGHLRQVVPDSLQFACEALTQRTALAGAGRVVEHIAAAVRCSACGSETTVDGPVVACGVCESLDGDLCRGDELELAWFEVVEEVV